MYETFEKLLIANNCTAYKVAKETGIPYSSLSDWKAGRSTPKHDKLEKIADYFNVTVDFIMGREPNTEIETDIQKKVKVMTRKAEEHLTKEESEKLAQMYADSIEMYLKAKGININE